MSENQLDPLVRSEACRIAGNLIRYHEGFRHRAYLCPAGIPTIGWGFTSYLSGRRVSLFDDLMTREAADKQLDIEVLRIVDTISGDAPVLSRDKYALGACSDFCYNLGIARFRSSTLLARLREGNFREAEREIMRWTKSKGMILPGLVKRRVAEAALLALVR